MAIEQIKEIALQLLANYGADAPESFTDALASEIARQMGGCMVYIAKRPLNRVERNAAIKREFNGRNIRQLCREYELSRASIYGIINNKE